MPRFRRAWLTARALSWSERRVLTRAWLLLAAVAAGMRILGFRRVHNMVLPRNDASTDGTDKGAAQSVARLVDAAARWSPAPANCLVRSLVLCNMLRRLGLAADIHIGVVHPDRNFTAHAWVEHRGIALADAGVLATQYIPFDTPASHWSS